MGIRLDVVGAVQLRERLERLQVRIADYDEMWAAIMVLMEEHEAEWFATAGDGSWPPLAQTTIKQKGSRSSNVGPWRDPQAGPFPPDPLIRTGVLLEELTDARHAAEFGQGRTTLGTWTTKTLSWGTDDPVAEYHQEGRTAGPGYSSMPERPVIVLTPGLLAKIDQAQEAFIEERVREVGLGD
jgi:phage gpG-like protein